MSGSRTLGRQHGVDWRLLAAIGYQESHWRSHAVSPTGVRGIMMLTQATADYLDIEDRMDPLSSIYGGATVLRPPNGTPPGQAFKNPIARGLPWPRTTSASITSKTRRQIVAWQGGDPGYLDRRQRGAAAPGPREKWYKRVQYGYARGWEPVLYVNNIRSYYNIMRWLTDNETPLEDEPSPAPEDIEIASVD